MKPVSKKTTVLEINLRLYEVKATKDMLDSPLVAERDNVSLFLEPAPMLVPFPDKGKWGMVCYVTIGERVFKLFAKDLAKTLDEVSKLGVLLTDDECDHE